MSRALHLEDGLALVATDLHGHWEAYERLRDAFVSLEAQGRVDYLILCGDVIHGYGPAEEDASLPILLDILALQAHYGPKVILLSGNHETPHIYGISLSKGNIEFTSRFEHGLARLPADGPDRAAVIAALTALPFYVTTRAGVLVCHAGASPAVQDANSAAFALAYDHAAVLAWADEALLARFDLNALRSNADYLKTAWKALAISGPDDARLPELLRAELIHQTSADYRFLWELLFTDNERQMGLARYAQLTSRFLDALSHHAPQRLVALVAGHIPTPGGHALVNDQHLRLSTYAHAQPRQAGQVLLLDCAQAVQSADDLRSGLRFLSSIQP